MDCEMDYLDGLPKKLPWKKSRKKYYPLVVCFDWFIEMYLPVNIEIADRG